MNRIGKILLGSIMLYLVSLGLIWVTASDPDYDTFPDECPNLTNCTRVADTSNRGEGLIPLEINADASEVISSILGWIDNQPRTTLLHNSSEFIHAKFLTAFFRFPDDFMVKIIAEGGLVTLWVQSQSRLGQSDLGVNEERVQAFFAYMDGLDF